MLSSTSLFYNAESVSFFLYVSTKKISFRDNSLKLIFLCSISVTQVRNLLVPWHRLLSQVVQSKLFGEVPCVLSEGTTADCGQLAGDKPHKPSGSKQVLVCTFLSILLIRQQWWRPCSSLLRNPVCPNWTGICRIPISKILVSQSVAMKVQKGTAELPR